MRVRVCSYNILSSRLATADNYPFCAPVNLAVSTRLEHIQAKLKVECGQGAVICLQEVPREWVGPLHVFFARSAYDFTSGHYGGKTDGYVGNAIAWPRALELLDAGMVRAAELLPPLEHDDGAGGAGVNAGLLGLVDGAEEAGTSSKPGLLRRLFLRLAGTRRAMVDRGPGRSRHGRPRGDVWDECAQSENVLVSVKLKASKGPSFSVTCCHMPSLSGSLEKKRAMIVHAVLAARVAERFADGSPYILAGSFNVKPLDPAYVLVTTGKLGAAFQKYCPQPRANAINHFDTAVSPLKSAYVASNGREPDFTIFSRSKWHADTVIATLDYIFCSTRWKVIDVAPLPGRDSLKRDAPFPSDQEPSDHILISAVLEAV